MLRKHQPLTNRLNSDKQALQSPHKELRTKSFMTTAICLPFALLVKSLWLILYSCYEFQVWHAQRAGRDS